MQTQKKKENKARKAKIEAERTHCQYVVNKKTKIQGKWVEFRLDRGNIWILEEDADAEEGGKGEEGKDRQEDRKAQQVYSDVEAERTHCQYEQKDENPWQVSRITSGSW